MSGASAGWHALLCRTLGRKPRFSAAGLPRASVTFLTLYSVYLPGYAVSLLGLVGLVVPDHRIPLDAVRGRLRWTTPGWTRNDE